MPLQKNKEKTLVLYKLKNISCLWQRRNTAVIQLHWMFEIIYTEIYIQHKDYHARKYVLAVNFGRKLHKRKPIIKTILVESQRVMSWGRPLYLGNKS